MNVSVHAKEKKVKPLIRIEGVSKVFIEARAVDNVSLTINEGEIFSLLGGSGSGKSTLLRMLAGFEQPTEGRIYLDGTDITDLPPYDRPINMMFQSYALFPHMTVEQNIAFGLKQDKLAKTDVVDRVAEILKLVQMSQYAARRPNQLSGGQRQRVALARSLAKRPKVLLLDEPMGALDKRLRSQMQMELVDIIERVGVTCVMVTHDQEEAMNMSRRIAVMHQGAIEQVGSPTDIYESPANRHVCEFIGSVNLFDGELVVDEIDHAVIQSPQLHRPIYIGHGISTSASSKAITYALRPEKVRLARDLPASHSADTYNWQEGTVHDIAYLGGHSIFFIKLASGFIVQCFVPSAERRGERPSWGEKVVIFWESNSGTALKP